MEIYSPYRICPIGAHIDHQLGIVLGTTINKGIYFRFSPNNAGMVRLHSLDYNEDVEFLLSDASSKTGHWSDYARGAVWALNEFCHHENVPSTRGEGRVRGQYDSPRPSGERVRVRGQYDSPRPSGERVRVRGLKYGIDAEIQADFPGGGLSSSAAIAVAYLLALEKVNNLHISAEENIKLVQNLENNYIGLNNGILDQSIILLTESIPNSMVYLDCKTLKHKIITPPQPAPSPHRGEGNISDVFLPTEEDKYRFSGSSPRRGEGRVRGDQVEFEVAVVYSGIEQSLSNTGYNRRVAECEEAARLLMEINGTRLPRDFVPRNDKKYLLRDVPEEVFHTYKNRLPENLMKRATHFFTEMGRVKKGADLWQKGDLSGFGKLMTESGKSSIENYECGTPALIRIYELLNSVEGVYGARFSGAGFRGSCIGLIKPSGKVRDAIREKIDRYYKKEFPQYAENCRLAFCQTNMPVIRP
jgi:galactokinase